MMNAASTLEMSVYVYQATLHNNPEDSRHHESSLAIIF